SRLSPRGRLVLVLLRLGAFLAMVFCLLRPSIVASSRTRQQATLLLLADGSESMTVADGPNGQSRWEHLRETLAAASPAARRAMTAQSLAIRTWVFDREARELPADTDAALQLNAWQRQPSAQETAIGSAIEDATRTLAGQRLAGVVLLSDGGQHAYPPRDLPPQAAARRLGEGAVPIWSIIFGRTRGAAQARDAAMVGLSVSETVFLGNKVEVAGRVRLDGLTDREATVRLSVEQPDGRLAEVARRTIRATEGAAEEPVRLEWTPDSLGERKLVLAVDPIEGETVATNNELSTFVEVVDGGLRVLYLEGSPRVEQRFLRRTLAASPDIQLDFRWIDSTRRDSWPIDLGQELTRDYKVFL
ncbi:MAG: VWA domain-containing protein, partial [Planctomycetia bacterium]|nr:VWA domain-containing protein [Planctomycetia bacterium]